MSLKEESAGNKIKKETEEFLRYFLCSVISLLLDIGIFSISIRVWGIHWVYAACIGFFVGSIFAYLGSIFWVFQARRMVAHKNEEFFIFVAIGVCGLALCEFMLWLGITVLGFAPEPSRAFASVVTFLFNFMVRKIALFRG
ncbi:MAG: GtrA family protein [Acetobacter sp.]